MKCIRFAAVVLLFYLMPCTVLASAPPASRWDNLLEVTYRFSWYPKSDLLALLEEKGGEYGMTLEGYGDQLQEELGLRTGERGRFDATSLPDGKAWKKYYRLSQVEYVLYLATDNSLHLENAQTAMTILAGKAEQPDVAFWQHLYAAHLALEQNDRRAFISGVFSLWQNVILKLEVDDLRMREDFAKAGFVKSLPYLYENVAHLVIRRAIIEKEMGGLAPLGVIILAIEKKLSVENGYRATVEATVERMHGLNSDNSNINFAVAFLEATANRHDFEAEKDASRLVDRFNQAEKFFLLAMDWADTQKGRAAALTQYMGFLNYVTRRLADGEDPLSRDPFFLAIPGTADKYLDQAIALYDDLAGPDIRNGGYAEAGFKQSNDYLGAMHKLWDSSAKLAIMLGSYYKTRPGSEGRVAVFPAESPLLKYCALFRKHARTDLDIVPDNAFFLVSYAAGELAGLYREQAAYSTDSRAGELFFAYQLQAVETFPIDVIGILQLAYQANQDGHLEDYFLHTNRIAERLKRTRAVGQWLAGHRTEYDSIVATIPTAVPQVMANAYSLVNFIQDNGDTEEGMYRKTMAMNGVLLATGGERGKELPESLLRAVGTTDFSNGNIVLDDGLKGQVPAQMAGRIQGALTEVSLYRYGKLKNELYASLTSPIHGLLRTLFYEISYDQHQYPQVARTHGTAKR
jgi:hypothetical protein